MKVKTRFKVIICLTATMLAVLMSTPQKVKANDFYPTCFAAEEIIGSDKWKYFYIVDVSGAVTEYVYNHKGLLVEETNPLGAVTTYEYDMFERLLKMKTPDGTVTEYEYTEDGLITKILAQNTYGKMESLQYLYAQDGSLTTAITSTTVDEYTYADNEKVASVTRNGKYRLEFDYDERGNLKELREFRCGILLPDAVTSYTYDDKGRVETVVQDGILVAKYHYDSMGWVQSQTDGVGNVTEYSYDGNYNLVVMETRTQDGVVLYREENKYNAKGSIILRVISGLVSEVTGSAGSFFYTYDEFDRLLVEQGNYGTINYTYDSMGNRLTKTENGVTTFYTYDLCNKLISEIMEETEVSYVYDAMGNLVEKSGKEGVTFYTYNLWNLPEMIINPQGECQENYYDAFGIRSVLIEDGEVIEYMTYNGIILAGYNVLGERVEHYVYGNKILSRD